MSTTEPHALGIDHWIAKGRRNSSIDRWSALFENSSTKIYSKLFKRYLDKFLACFPIDEQSLLSTATANLVKFPKVDFAVRFKLSWVDGHSPR